MFCPRRARVHTAFVPSPYDTESLKLEVSRSGESVADSCGGQSGVWQRWFAVGPHQSFRRSASHFHIGVDILPTI